MKAARFPQIKTLDDFDFSFQRSVKRQTVAHLAQLDFLAEAKNVIFLGPPGTGKTHLSIALGVQAARRGHRVAFATAHEWVLKLGAAKRAGRLEEELERLGRMPLLVVDEVGYIPFDPEAAALFFALVSSRYERSSLVVSSNKTFSAWAEIFGDPVAVAAMVDRLVHHAEYDRGTEAFGALARKLEGYLRLAAGWTKEQEVLGFPNLLIIVPEGVREGEVGSALRHAIGSLHLIGSLATSFPLYVASEDGLTHLGVLGPVWRHLHTDGDRLSLVDLPARRDLYRATRCLGRYFIDADPGHRRRISPASAPPRFPAGVT